MSVGRIFPVEWAQYFSQREDGVDICDIDEDFGFDEWCQWIENNHHLVFESVDDTDTTNTRHHDVSEFEGQTLCCYRFYFRDTSARPNRAGVIPQSNLPKHLRISVPEPTKLPLPKEKSHA